MFVTTLCTHLKECMDDLSLSHVHDDLFETLHDPPLSNSEVDNFSWTLGFA
jgi:hypothetical protein